MATSICKAVLFVQIIVIAKRILHLPAKRNPHCQAKLTCLSCFAKLQEFGSCRHVSFLSPSPCRSQCIGERWKLSSTASKTDLLLLLTSGIYTSCLIRESSSCHSNNSHPAILALSSPAKVPAALFSVVSAFIRKMSAMTKLHSVSVAGSWCSLEAFCFAVSSASEI